MKLIRSLSVKYWKSFWCNYGFHATMMNITSQLWTALPYSCLTTVYNTFKWHARPKPVSEFAHTSHSNGRIQNRFQIWNRPQRRFH